MDLGLADFGDGGREAKQWQQRHNRRKNAAWRKQQWALYREEEKKDLAKRRRKWRQRLKEAKAVGVPWRRLPKPPRVNRAQHVDIMGQRFGRLLVLRPCCVSSNRGKNKRWWVQCDCGHAEHRVAATNLRQGITVSCGCLTSEAAKKGWMPGGHFRKRIDANRAKEARPLSIKLRDVRHLLIKLGQRKAARTITAARILVREAEIAHGISKRKIRK